MILIPLSPPLAVWVVEDGDTAPQGPFKALAISYTPGEETLVLDEMDPRVLVATKGHLIWYDETEIYFDAHEAMRICERRKAQ